MNKEGGVKVTEEKYVEAMKGIKISPEAKQRILTKSIQTNQKQIQEKGTYIMGIKKRVVVVAVAAAMLFSATALAASGIFSSWVGSTSGKANYTSLPSIEQSVKDVGYAPVLIEQFENGYVFSQGQVVENSLTTDSKNSAIEFKSFMFRYVKDGNMVLFSQRQHDPAIQESGTLISSNSGYDFYFTGYTNKVVPTDYELTEDDKHAEACGELVFTYGSDDVSICEVKGLTWTTGDLAFTLTQIDGELSADDMVQMAQYIIAQNEK